MQAPKKDEHLEKIKDPKQKAMTTEEFYKKLNKDDRRALRNLNNNTKISFVPTGSWVINTLIGDGTGNYKPGGLPRGHIVEVFGNESCGKTTLGISACKQAQVMGGVPVWLDFERTFQKDYAERLGVDCNPNKFIFFEPEHFEHGIKLIYQSLAMRPPIVVVDSVSAMIPRQFLEGKIDEPGRIGMQAQLMSASLNFLTKYISSTNTCLLFINQLRSVIKKNTWDHGPDEETSGGRALKYYSSVRLKMKTSTINKIEVMSRITGKLEKEPVNVTVNVTVAKNKIDKPFYTGPIYIRFGEGFDNITSIVELACNTGTIKKSGAFYTFSSGGKTLLNAQGKDQIRVALEQDSELLKTISSSIVFTEDLETKKQIEAEDAVDGGNLDGGELDLILNQTSETFIKNKEEREKAKSKKKDDNAD